jgi:hypothetical protein
VQKEYLYTRIDREEDGSSTGRVSAICRFRGRFTALLLLTPTNLIL